MADLVIPANTIRVLREYGFNFKKKLGQNFLIDPHVLSKIGEAAGLDGSDAVLEIGPGIGTVTQYLCENAGHVLAIEIDSKLIGILENDTLAGYGNVEIVHGDALKLDLAALISEKLLGGGGGKIKVVANLPYYITTPVIMELLPKGLPIESLTLMVQEEVARRMQAVPGTKDYGALSLAVRYYAEPEIEAFVPPNSFMPRPKVGSAVVNLVCHEPPVSTKSPEYMFKVIRASFRQRRKTLANSLANAEEVGVPKEGIAEAIAVMQEKCGLAENPSIRGETLGLGEFAVLADVLGEKRIEM